MKHLDIYRWSYKDPDNYGPSPYWCSSRIGIVIEDRLVDTYWGWPPDHISSDVSRKWTLDGAQAELDLEFVANLNELEVLTDVPDWYDDVIDLTHPNTSRNLRFIKKGQKRSRTAQINDLRDQIASLRSDVNYAEGKIKSLQADLDQLAGDIEAPQ